MGHWIDQTPLLGDTGNAIDDNSHYLSKVGWDTGQVGAACLTAVEHREGRRTDFDDPAFVGRHTGIDKVVECNSIPAG